MYILRAYNTWQLTDCNTQNGAINHWIHDFSPINNFGSVIEGLVVVGGGYEISRHCYAQGGGGVFQSLSSGLLATPQNILLVAILL